MTFLHYYFKIESVMQRRKRKLETKEVKGRMRCRENHILDRNIKNILSALPSSYETMFKLIEYLCRSEGFRC